MNTSSIYQLVKNKLGTHGVENSKDGLLTLNDQKLFSLFVDLERAKRISSFSGVQSASHDIEKYLISIDKRELMAFTYMYLYFSDFTPARTEVDEYLEDGWIKKSKVFRNNVSDEEMLIGLWATVQYELVGQAFLRIIYANK